MNPLQVQQPRRAGRRRQNVIATTAGSLLIGILVTLWGSPGVALTLMNGGFDDPGGPFTAPAGWTPWGDAKFEGAWDQNWHAQVASVLPNQNAGLYQVIPDAVPGMRYRLSVRLRSGDTNLACRAGLSSRASVDPAAAVWTPGTNQNSWIQQQVEAVAESGILMVFLEVRNTNSMYPIYASARWDDVTLTVIGGTPQPTATPPPAAPLPAANDAFASLADLWSLAAPKSGVRTLLAGTHHPDPESNADFDRVEGTVNEGGETWTVLKSFDGPGALLRIWMTNFRAPGRIRVEIDGVRVHDETLQQFFGTMGQTVWPVANRTTGAWVSYVPMSFTQSARVLVRDAEQYRFYWQITWQQFDSAEGVRRYTNPLHPVDAAHYRRIRDQWGAASVNPKLPKPGAQESSGSVNAGNGAAVTFWSQGGAGIIDALYLDVPSSEAAVLQNLRLRMTWDGASAPQVDAPFGLFFGAGYGKTVVRGLLSGIAPPHGAYCYFPMPFADGARLEIANLSGQAVNNIRYRVRWNAATPSAAGPMRLHTHAVRDNRAGQGRPLELLNVRGEGHLAGLSAAMADGNTGGYGFLEGDEYVWVDGEPEPSTAGTGTEDYFTCGWYFQDGPRTFPVIGAPDLINQQRVSAYRFHVPDWIPFTESLRFAIEVGDTFSGGQYGDYSTVVYYYLKTDLSAPPPTGATLRAR